MKDPIPKELHDILACSVDKADLKYTKDKKGLKCTKCGHMVEFFKTDGILRCSKCGERIRNPAVALGCAQWCQYARECLGFDPKSLDRELQEDSSLADRLIAAMKAEFGDDQRRALDSFALGLTYFLQQLNNYLKVIHQ